MTALECAPDAVEPKTNAGFSTAAPEQLYLPIEEAPAAQPSIRGWRPGLAAQHDCRLIALRKAHPALAASGV